MQHVNDDMDEIFRRAGENYPLHTGKPDWDKVHQALMQATPAEQPTSRNNKQLLWLLLLLPIVFVCTRYWKGGNENDLGLNGEKATTTHAGSPVATSVAPGERVVDAKKKSGAAENVDVPINTTMGQLQKGKPIAPSAISAGSKKRIKKEAPQVGAISAAAPADGTNAGTKTLRSQAFEKAGSAKTKKSVVQTTVATAEKTSLTATDSRTSNAAPLNALVMEKVALPSVQPSPIFKAASLALDKDPLLQQATTGAAKKEATQHLKKLYAGVMGSADLTTVKMQKTSGVGSQFGVLVGYQFGNRWSLETGIYRTKKFYYTEGDYFSTSRAYRPPNSKITEVDGSCTMLEVPLTVKYDLATRRRATFFASTGLTSYIMKKEQYDFLYYYTNSGTYAMHSKSYRNATTNLLSVWQLSGGIQQKMGRATSIRIEPYLKLPITGLGYGRLHFTSAGMNVGIIRKF